MTLTTYSNLIRNLPYLDQAFETKQSLWIKECGRNKRFEIFCNNKFKGSALQLSRRDLFVKCSHDFYDAIILIIFWGYPRRMRGEHFSRILDSIPILEKSLKINKEISFEAFKQLCKNTKRTGVGLSTLTKFLYFFEFNIEGYRCLILDQRIIEVLSKGLYVELSALKKINEYNKESCYKEYLMEMDKISKAESYKPDQLEFFLYRFGMNLKSEREN